jgi:hypothetical protein
MRLFWKSLPYKARIDALRPSPQRARQALGLADFLEVFAQSRIVICSSKVG